VCVCVRVDKVFTFGNKMLNGRRDGDQ